VQHEERKNRHLPPPSAHCKRRGTECVP
jgi:hypothetical protein